MVVLQLGQPYPLHNQANGPEKVRADLTTDFFGICYYIKAAGPGDVASWRGPFEYGIYEAAPGVPFVLARFAAGRWPFDVSLNWRNMSYPTQRAAWAEHDGLTPLTFALLDARTNRLLAYRRFAPAAPFVAQVRAAARRQLTHFADHQAVEQAISRAELMPLPLMCRQATFYPSPDDSQ